MSTNNAQGDPSEAEFDLLISRTHDRLHYAIRENYTRNRQRKSGRKIAAGGLALLVLAGGGAAAAKVGPFEPKATTDYSNLEGPVGMNGQPAGSPDENSVTRTPWPKNEFGLTVGEPTRADVIARNLPDLMPVVTARGEPGFLRSAEVYFYTNEGEVESRSARVEIYRPDGKTSIGRL